MKHIATLSLLALILIGCVPQEDEKNNIAQTRDTTEEPSRTDAKALQEYLDDTAFLRELVEKSRSLGRDADGFLEFISRIERQLESGDVISAIKEAQLFLDVLTQKFNHLPSEEFTAYFGLTHNMLSELIEMAKDGKESLPRGLERFTATPSVEMLDGAEPRRMQFLYAFPELSYEILAIGGRIYTGLSLPGSDLVQRNPGGPWIPEMRTLIALPIGGVASLDIQAITGAGTIPVVPAPQKDFGLVADPEMNVELYPLPKFAITEAEYSGTIPADPCTIEPMGTFRDTPLAMISCAAGQYDAKTQELSLFSEITVEVVVEGASSDTPYFTTYALGGFEPTQWLKNLVSNGDLIETTALFAVTPSTDFSAIASAAWNCTLGFSNGESLIIFTIPELAEEAERLAQRRRAEGIPTRVQWVGPTTSLTTAAEIDEFIEYRWDTCSIRPSFVLLFGDSDQVPTFSYTSELGAGSVRQIASDHPYGSIGEVEQIPDIMVGRVPVRTPEQASAFVDRMLSYVAIGGRESSEFFDKATILSVFECCEVPPTVGWPALITDASEYEYVPEGKAQRRFHEIASGMYDTLLDAGMDPERFFSETVSKAYKEHGGSTAPRYDADGSGLRADLLIKGGFRWYFDERDDVIGALEKDRPSLLYYSAHGFAGGWASPRFDTRSLGELKDGGRYPFVFAFTCAAGIFDNEIHPEGLETDTRYFTETLVAGDASGYRAAGAITHTRVVYENTAVLMENASVDALFPDHISDFGGDDPVTNAGELALRVHTRAAMGLTAGEPFVNPGQEVTRNTQYGHLITILAADPSMDIQRRSWPDYDVQVEWVNNQFQAPEVNLPDIEVEEAMWWMEGDPDSDNTVIWDASYVDESEYTFSEENPVVVPWRTKGLTVLGLPDGARVFATTGDTESSFLFLGARTSYNGRADIYFIEGDTTPPVSATVYALLPQGISVLLQSSTGYISYIAGIEDFGPNATTVDLYGDLDLNSRLELAIGGIAYTANDATTDAGLSRVRVSPGHVDDLPDVIPEPGADAGVMRIVIPDDSNIARALVEFQYAAATNEGPYNRRGVLKAGVTIEKVGGGSFQIRHRAFGEGDTWLSANDVHYFGLASLSPRTQSFGFTIDGAGEYILRDFTFERPQ